LSHWCYNIFTEASFWFIRFEPGIFLEVYSGRLLICIENRHKEIIKIFGNFWIWTQLLQMMKIYINVLNEFKPSNHAPFHPGDMKTCIHASTGLSVVMCYFVLIFSLYFRRRLNIKFKEKKVLINKGSAPLHLKKNEIHVCQAMTPFYFQFPLT